MGEGVVDGAGGEMVPTGDPFLDMALREAREDAEMFGRPRDAKYVMRRARELWCHQCDVEGADTEPTFIERKAAVALADELSKIEIARRLKEAGVKEPEDSGESPKEIEERVAKRMRGEGWIMRSEVDSIIERRSDQKAVVKAKDTLSWMKMMLLAVINVIIPPCLPERWKMVWLFGFMLLYLPLIYRIHRKWKKVIAEMEERIGEKVDPEDLSIQRPVKLPTDPGIEGMTPIEQEPYDPRPGPTP